MISIFLEPISIEPSKIKQKLSNVSRYLEWTAPGEALASAEVCAQPELPDAEDRARNRRSGSAAVLDPPASRIRLEFD
ncbi:MAG: hypothetical protein ACREDT_11070 [Methylocella sp.]